MRSTRFAAVALAACLLLCLFGLVAPASAQCPGGSCSINSFAALPPAFYQAPTPAPVLAPAALPATACQPGQSCSLTYSYSASTSITPSLAPAPTYAFAALPTDALPRAAPIAGIPIAVGRAVTLPFRAVRFGGFGFGCRSCR